MDSGSKNILCQPDNQKACCVCCGLFNFSDISKEKLEWILCNSPLSISDDERFDKKPAECKSVIRDITSHICRYQGFIAYNRPGCTLHPLFQGSDKRGKSLYGSRICRDYLCPAHEILDEQLKKYLISNVNNWYEYSIAIIDPESFIWIQREVEARSSGKSCMKELSSQNLAIQECLSVHGEYLSRSTATLFHYSRAEYNNYKASFIIDNNKEEQLEIRSLIERRL